MTDGDTCLNALKEAVCAFRDERNWRKFHTPKNLASSIAIEAAELLEIFQWEDVGAEDARKEVSLKHHIEEELADVIIYCLSLANVLDIDVSSSVFEKLEKNERKYPRSSSNRKLFK